MTNQYAAPVRRPGAVTFIGAILYIQAFMAVVALLTMLIWRGSVLDYLEKEGSPISGAAYNGTLIAEGIMAILLFFVATGIMRGNRGVRFLVAIVQGISMAAAIYGLTAHHVGGYVYRSVFSLFVGVFVLWALYGNRESDEYFHQH
ncbi:hypothetical protein [Ilumatobacter nonamiensis]|uniref:hypothetical protein n=1 Tax=Ilumatobacter nonamiensis TaxID=467093 RepID=UPI0003487BBA|nr:hypothetical protein [Ilumatobacter nonamiensis]